MPITNPAQIRGVIKGAYIDEGFDIPGNGPTSLTALLQHILDSLGSGGGSPDGNGIYSGSGNIPASAVATALGSFKIASIGQILTFGDDVGTFQSFLNKLTNGTWGFRVADATDGLECDVQVYKTGFFVETDSSIAPQVTQVLTTKDEIQLSANNGSGSIVIVRITPKSVRMTGIPNYANDAAADADSALLAGSLYTVSGSRSLMKKP